jgi:hypothetical protein
MFDGRIFDSQKMLHRVRLNSEPWVLRHKKAIELPQGPERPIVRLLEAWLLYAEQHQERYESKIGDDGVLGKAWEAIGVALRGLLNGECGRLDCGTLDSIILDSMKENGIDVSQL